ncbi:Uncharacterized protein OS=Microcystis aeruginosa SPC777 GN=MAESPC_02777 PE=4 SV=1 [Gemmata massiliana]|uniref:Uncharacterized protein n=1 Tax=Gemmata massiliana TaxID=1210884 RepID=A0A6P2CXU4_9BACT|nr:hypothetical protein [Gemmata massiliana]VTR92925.1 Uncharacterized protein OS=Microcystis aeruginosa SPC777 GN=MAESPC_02777 PE=4 SV=1 [Gemmata massiliana]
MAVNTTVLRGSSATLNLAKVASRGGELGNVVINTDFAISTVGRIVGVEVVIETTLEAFHEIGRRHPVSLHPGGINIRGRVTRAHINGAFLRLLLGEWAKFGQAAPPDELQPEFNMVIDLTDVASTSGQGGTKVIVSGVQFENWSVVVPDDHFVMENTTFKALRVQHENKGD